MEKNKQEPDNRSDRIHSGPLLVRLVATAVDLCNNLHILAAQIHLDSLKLT